MGDHCHSVHDHFVHALFPSVKQQVPGHPNPGISILTVHRMGYLVCHFLAPSVDETDLRWELVYPAGFPSEADWHTQLWVTSSSSIILERARAPTKTQHHDLATRAPSGE